jgi:hypothetical protein
MDEQKINFLKERYGYTQTYELFNYILTTVYEQTRNQQQLTVSQQA